MSRPNSKDLSANQRKGYQLPALFNERIEAIGKFFNETAGNLEESEKKRDKQLSQIYTPEQFEYLFGLHYKKLVDIKKEDAERILEIENKAKKIAESVLSDLRLDSMYEVKAAVAFCVRTAEKIINGKLDDNAIPRFVREYLEERKRIIDQEPDLYFSTRPIIIAKGKSIRNVKSIEGADAHTAITRFEEKEASKSFIKKLESFAKPIPNLISKISSDHDLITSVEAVIKDYEDRFKQKSKYNLFGHHFFTRSSIGSQAIIQTLKKVLAGEFEDAKTPAEKAEKLRKLLSDPKVINDAGKALKQVLSDHIDLYNLKPEKPKEPEESQPTFGPKP